MRNNDAGSIIGGLILFGITIYIVLWSWSYLSSQLDSTFFALLLTIPLTGIIFWCLKVGLILTISIFASLFSSNR